MNQAIDMEDLVNNVLNDDLAGKIHLPCMVSKQGSRIVYQLNLMFRQITNLFDHTEARPLAKNDSVEVIDIKALRNRYLRTDKVNDLANYIRNNLESYILPPISAVSEKPFSFRPYDQEKLIEKYGEEFDLVKHPYNIDRLLEVVDLLHGILILRESDFNVEILDGNHRVAAIQQLSGTAGREFKNLRIGVQIFCEDDLSRQRQAFVDMNTSTPIDKTILTLFSNRDSLSLAAKETIGDNPDYLIEEFNQSDKDHYIGFDAINDSISRNSSAVLSLNMVKNMLVKFCFGESGTPRKFTTSLDPKSLEYDKLLKDFSLFFKTVFRSLPPFNEIKHSGLKIIPNLREQYISLTGAGLYIIANIGYIARSKNKDLARTAIELGKLDWRREISTATGENVMNELFRSGILSENGNIASNRSAHNSTLEAVVKALGI